MNSTSRQPANFTRQTADLPARFRQEGRAALIPLYHLLRLSDFAREGIDRSGSYLFADHLYRNEASGFGWFGRWLDRRLLNLPAAKAMRSRYQQAREEMYAAFEAHLRRGETAPFRILTVPCGIPRDVVELAARLADESLNLLPLLEYHGLDLDPAVVAAAETFLAASSLRNFHTFQGDALDPASYRRGPYHFVASTGLGEFLDDKDLGRFYECVFDALAPGGIFFTSATAFDRRSDALLRTFELRSHYRTPSDLARLLGGRPWTSTEYTNHPSGLQTFVRAVKPGGPDAST